MLSVFGSFLMLVLLRTFLVAGHVAILLVNDKEKGYYYNMAKDGNFTSYTLTPEEVKNVLEQGDIDPDSQDPDTDIDHSNHTIVISKGQLQMQKQTR